jgi:DME family drug/metabolite transporter
MTASAPTLLASSLALLAAVQFAASSLLVKRGLAHGDSISGASVQIAVSFVVFALAAPLAISAADWLSPAVWIFAAVGLMRPVFSTMLAYEGTRRLGPTISSTVESTAPLFAVAGGVLVLSEHLTLSTLLGTLGVVAGILVLSQRSRLRRGWPLWALGFPLCAALIRSAAHVAVKIGLLLLPNVVLSGLVAYGVSLLVALGVLGVRRSHERRAGQGHPGRRWRSAAGSGWFALSGLSNAGAIFALNSALRIGDVVQVSPVTASVPVFTLLGSWLFLRQESLTRRMVLGVLLVVPSVALITLGG